MMQFNLEHGIAILERTPASLTALLSGLPDVWVMSNEGGDSWSPYDVIGHLAYVEATDWLRRVQIVIEHGESLPFKPVDRFAMFEASKGKSLQVLLDEFTTLRRQSIDTLHGMNLGDDDFVRTGRHPALGQVHLSHLLAAWVVHDLNHIHQIAKTMSRQYREAVGPWRQFLLVLDV